MIIGRWMAAGKANAPWHQIKRFDAAHVGLVARAGKRYRWALSDWIGVWLATGYSNELITAKRKVAAAYEAVCTANEVKYAARCRRS